ncbi:MAG: Asp-tRNA(Asn)/Glu-tRNA(Gln) amidotransferase subunit GatC [Candidatus Mcinerneyibacterium aminivorans]|jgi:aspartyl-tRNA(Asn)/glutamyl-tRNA(Gln) amidotransferase subunit C|uniref:Asp-tRNA(Asn)/Glu-tRNA(Gln) amidotransferase subunit GatC n=1 Tax=Candidatus Mcinerneyibacterium aminivorans TaxID=2703815 RepID=A0A5D0MAR0_9BACT|nr:MAG: Asp-tRNA(Asn)/Glu-tRNA(Gln) amidotransferase subunit GatC [Candidatus Mcinerneyibacterium aminivorans]
MTEISIKKMKELISIDLTGKEEEKLKKDFSKIIEYVDKISEIEEEKIDYLENSRDIKKLTHKEEIENFQSIQKIRDNFPKKIKNYLAVPKYIGE